MLGHLPQLPVQSDVTVSVMVTLYSHTHLIINFYCSINNDQHWPLLNYLIILLLSGCKSFITGEYKLYYSRHAENLIQS